MQLAQATHAGTIEDKIVVDPTLNRTTVSYQGNKGLAGFRWFRFKEGFSTSLVEKCLLISGGQSVLDPFSGSGTAVMTACRMGRRSVGIDVMPIGERMVGAICAVAGRVSAADVRSASKDVLAHVAGGGGAAVPYGHLRITSKAFTRSTEKAIARARYAIGRISDPDVRKVIDFACMSVLEEISWTRKDGQFLRWDPKSGRDVAPKLDKGRLPPFRTALLRKTAEIASDAQALKDAYTGPPPEARTASCLEALKGMKSRSIDTVVTSPPYANRYDYTRTYALELAWLGYGEAELSALRQSMLTATVENRPKTDMLEGAYGRSALPRRAFGMADENRPLQKALGELRRNAKNLNNPHIIRLVENYFAEMALVILELGRIVRRDVFMVNDNVRYHGIHVPVDVILSEFAEGAGFRCESIRALPKGKGNSSQQMGEFGREEIRKCVYRWTK